MRVVANVDDPLVVWAASAAERRHVGRGRRGVAQRRRRVPGVRRAARARPPTSWSCPDVRARAARSRRSSAGGTALRVDGDDYPYTLALPGRANRGNVAMAVGAAGALGVPTARARSARSQAVREVSGRYARHRVDGHEVIVLLAKNPAGWVETLDVIDDLLPDSRAPSSSRSTRAVPTAAIRRGCGTFRSSSSRAAR